MEPKSCTAKIRPFRPVNETEVVCNRDPVGHSHKHGGEIRDYAYEGSLTTMFWFETDRRTFHGEWPGDCPENSPQGIPCLLPKGHRGDCAF